MIVQLSLQCAIFSLPAFVAGAAPPFQENTPGAQGKYGVDWTINFNHPNYTVGSDPHVLDPEQTFGIWEGWGVSLAWWANVFGANRDLADATFSRNTVKIANQEVPGLGMNIARFNLGASSWNEVQGQRMSVSKTIIQQNGTFKLIQGYWLDWNNKDPTSSSWNFDLPDHQLDMLKLAIERGANVLELFSNAPMWWMDKNHNPSGGDNGDDNNLQDWNFVNHPHYLIATAAYFKQKHNIEFNYIEPFNEPYSSYWTADGTQEGCHFDHSLQAWIVKILHEQLTSQSNIAAKIASSDEWHTDMATDTWDSFNDKTKSFIDKVNVHGYQYTGGRRDKLYDALHGKRLWMSETGDGGASGAEMATNIHLDFFWMHPTAWCYWQIVDEADGWGMFQAGMRGDGNHDISTVNPKVYVMAQYTRHILPGMKIIKTSTMHTLAAYDDVNHILVFVTINPQQQQTKITYDLSKFLLYGSSAVRWQTNAVDKYARYEDVQIYGNYITVSFPAETVQTFEVRGARTHAVAYV